MNFGAPAFFWSLLVLLPLAGAYFLKVRPRRHSVNAWFLWEQVLRQKATSSLFHKLRDLLSLLLVLFAVAALCIALTKPRLGGENDGDLLLVIDTSMSMRTVEGGGTRLEMAKEKARAMVNALNGSQRGAVAIAGEELRFVTHFTDDPGELLAGIDEIEAEDGVLATSGLRSLPTKSTGTSTNVVFMTDGCPAVESLPEGVAEIRVGSDQGNLGVVAADLQWEVGRPGVATVYVRVLSTFKEAIEGEVEVREVATGRIAKIMPFRLDAGDEHAVVAQIDGALPGRWEVECRLGDGGEDALSADNIVPLALHEIPPLKVGVAAEEAFFFEACLQSFARSGGALVGVKEGAEVVVTDGTSEVDAPLVVAFVGGVDESPWCEQIGDPLNELLPKARAEGHALLKNLDLAAVGFPGARILTPPSDALVVLEDEGTGAPLIYVVKNGQSRIAVFNMDPLQNEFYLSPWFPVIIYSGVTGLSERTEELRAVYPVGSSVLPPGGMRAVVKNSDGVEMPRNELGAVKLKQAGFYQVVLPEGDETWLATSTLSEDESKVDVRVVGNDEEVYNVASGLPLPIWLLVVGLVVLGSEFAMYHRRVVG